MLPRTFPPCLGPTVAYKWTVLPVAVCAFAMLGLNIVPGVIHIRRSCLLATIYLGVLLNGAQFLRSLVRQRHMVISPVYHADAPPPLQFLG